MKNHNPDQQDESTPDADMKETEEERRIRIKKLYEKAMVKYADALKRLKDS